MALAAHDRPVLIAGPTASGKSGLALAIAEAHGGRVVNADALQVYGLWHILTARPSAADLARAPHALYGHVAAAETYSAGRWLADIAALPPGPRPIVVGGTGLYLTALTEGLSRIPPVPPRIRARADALSPAEMLDALDAATRARIDQANPARIRRAWEVLEATGRGLASWQDMPAPPLVPLASATAMVLHAPPARLGPRIEARVDAMLAAGALEEVRAALPGWDVRLPAFRAIGAAELRAHLRGEIPLAEARERIIVATRRYAKRQRTWLRARMARWQPVTAT